MTCARAIRQGGFRVGHLGHLVQIPKHEIAEAVSFAPRYWTVFSRFQAELISTALSRGARQAVLLRVYGRDDVVVPTHAGGFAVETIDADIDYIAGLPGIDIAGVTTYPSANFDRLDRVVVETPNVRSMLAVAEKLRRRDAKDVQINMAQRAFDSHDRAGGEIRRDLGRAWTRFHRHKPFADFCQCAGKAGNDLSK